MKKKTRSRRSGLSRNKKTKLVLFVTCGLIVSLGLVTVAGPGAPLRSKRISSLFLSPPSPLLPSANSPSKEYIYAGGRLIATEERSFLKAAANLIASPVSNSQINISWSSSPDAHHYQIERAPNLAGVFTILNANVTGTSFTDTSVTSVNAYLYRVRAADASGNLSEVSNIDVATAIVFDDDPLPSLPTLTLVKAQHVFQLRQAVNAVRAAADLPPATWTQNPLQPSITTIKAKDVEELRTALDQALARLGLPVGGYTNPSLTNQFIQGIHIKELRDRVK